MKVNITLVVSLFIVCMHAQTVRTISEGNFHDGLAIDETGAVYGSDFPGDTVYKYTPDGDVSVFKSGFTSPNGIGIDPLGDIYICDHFANTIYKYNPDGDLLDTYAGLTTPAGIKNIPGTNDMLFVEYNTGDIKIINADLNTIETLYDDGLPVNGPAGIAFIGSDAYIGNFNDRKIFKFENNNVSEIAQLPSSAPEKNFLGFLTSYNGNLYATQIGEGRIYKIKPDTGDVSIFAGSVLGNNDGPLGSATFNEPNGIIVDEVNNIMYVSDAATKNLRIIEGINLGVSEKALPFSFQLYPNPSPNEITVRFPKETKIENALLVVYNALGKEVINHHIVDNPNGEIIINVSALQQGTYLVAVTQGRNSFTAKFIK